MINKINLYIARCYLRNLLLIILLFNGVILLFDIIEQIRVFASYNLSFALILKLSIFRMFYLMQKTNAYAVLLAGIFTYISLTKNSELTIFKAAGASNFMLIIPSIASAAFFGLIMTTLINPISSRMISEYEKMESTYKKGSISALSISKTGLWIKDNLKNSDGGERIIHALRISQVDHELHEATVYILDENQAFKRRFDIEKIQLVNSTWVGKNATEYDSINNSIIHQNFTLPTSITFNHIQESMLMPETISFWRLPTFISLAEESGFSAIKHKIYFYKLLIQPLYFAAMVLLGIAFSLSLPRAGKTPAYVAFALLMGFALNFFEYFVLALGTTGKIPVVLAAFSPTLAALILGLYIQLHMSTS